MTSISMAVADRVPDRAAGAEAVMHGVAGALGKALVLNARNDDGAPAAMESAARKSGAGASLLSR